MPSFILFRPTVRLQYSNVTDRTDRQDRRTADRIDRQRSDSINGTNGRPKILESFVIIALL